MSHRPTLVALATVLALALPAAGARAGEPTPAPDPAATATTSDASPAGWQVGTPSRPMPDASLIGKPAAVKKAALSAALPKGLATPIKNLLADVRSGKVSGTRAAAYAETMIRTPKKAPARYRLKKKQATERDLNILGGFATGSTGGVSTGNGRLEPGAFCVLGDCEFRSGHAVVEYFPAVLSQDELTDVGGEAGTPDYVESVAAQLNQAWGYYQDDLGMKIDVSSVRLILLPWNPGACGSWPNRVIYCFPHLGDVEYFAAHELYHQFEWTYQGAALSLNITSENASRIWGNINRINPWMEATANWATAHYAQAKLNRPTTATASEIRDVATFFAKPELGLADGVLQGVRQYGVTPAVEFLTQQTNLDYVRQSWAAVEGDSYLDGFSQINAALSSGYGLTLSELTPLMWQSLYTMCDPVPTDGQGWWWQLRGPIVVAWCGTTWVKNSIPATGPGTRTRRPDHHDITASRGSGSYTDQLASAGASFADFRIATPANSLGTRLILEFNRVEQAGSTAYLAAWKDTPGGEDCSVREQPYPESKASATAIAYEVPADCHYVTFAYINADNGTSGTGAKTSSFTVTWRAMSSGVEITNGNLTMGVNPDGSLVIGQPIIVGRAALTGHEYGPGMWDESSGREAFAHYSTSEGWGVVDHKAWAAGSPLNFFKPAVSGRVDKQRYGGAVSSFTFTTSTATSVVPVGTSELVHYWHPSKDPNVYQLDVTLRKSSSKRLPSGASLTYRRVVPFGYNRWDDLGNPQEAPDYLRLARGTGDGISTLTTCVGDACEFTDQPTVELPTSPAFADLGFDQRRERGIAFDVPLEGKKSSAKPKPQLTLFYGATDTVAQADAALARLKVSTSATAAVYTDEPTNPAVFLLGYKRNA